MKGIHNILLVLPFCISLFLSSKLVKNERNSQLTNSAGDKRIMLGVRVTDGYRDTVEDGIQLRKVAQEIGAERLLEGVRQLSLLSLDLSLGVLL